MVFRIESEGKTEDEFFNEFAHIPASETEVDLSENNLWNKDVDKLCSAFATLPPHITSVDLTHNQLFFHELRDGRQITANELTQIFSSLPPTVKKIKLGFNYMVARLGTDPDKETFFTQAISALKHVTEIDFSDSEIDYYPLEWANILRALPPQITTLIMRRNDLGWMQGKNSLKDGLYALINAVPPNISKVDIAENRLARFFSKEQLLAWLANFPPSIKSLNLSGNRLRDIGSHAIIEATPYLRELNLSNNKLLPSQTRPAHEFLEILDLSNNRYTNKTYTSDKLFQVLATAPTSVRLLKLHNNFFVTTLNPQWAQSEHIQNISPQLEQITLSEREIADFRVQDLIKLGHALPYVVKVTAMVGDGILSTPDTETPVDNDAVKLLNKHVGEKQVAIYHAVKEHLNPPGLSLLITDYLDYDRQKIEDSPPPAAEGISFSVISAFLGVVGGAGAMLIALTLLQGAAAITVAALGTAAVLGGIGLFAYLPKKRDCVYPEEQSVLDNGGLAAS
jgi:hypothetical protein